MPKLSFFQLSKIFVAGFIGYAVLVALVSVGAAILFPDYIKGRFDMSIHTFLQMVLYFFGFFGLITTSLMLLGAWGVLRLVIKRDCV